MTVPFVIGDLVKVRLWCSNAEQASVNTFYYMVTGVGAPPATDTDMANALDTGFFSTAMPPVLSNQSQYEGVQVQIIRPPALFVAAIATAGHGAGTGGSIALPRQACGLTHWGTPFAGRAYRGRTYWPFPSTTHDNGDGVPTVAYVNLITTLSGGLQTFTSVATGGRTATVVLVMFHRKNKAGLIPIPTAINFSLNEDKWATQRRRGSFGRPNVSPI